MRPAPGSTQYALRGSISFDDFFQFRLGPVEVPLRFFESDKRFPIGRPALALIRRSSVWPAAVPARRPEAIE